MTYIPRPPFNPAEAIGVAEAARRRIAGPYGPETQVQAEAALESVIAEHEQHERAR